MSSELNRVSGTAQERKSLLWIFSEFPASLDSGFESRREGHRGDLDFLELCRELSAIELDIILFDSSIDEAFYESMIRRSDLPLRRIYVFPISLKSRRSPFLRVVVHFLSRLTYSSIPSSLRSFASRSIGQGMRALFEGRALGLKENGVRVYSRNDDDVWTGPDWQAVLFDGYEAAVSFFNGKRCEIPDSSSKILFRPRAFASGDLFREVREIKDELIRGFYEREPQLLRAFELAFLRKVDTAFPISSEERDEIRALIPRVQSKVLPPAFRFPNEPPPRSVNEKRFLLIGSGEERGDNEAIRRFLFDIWPECLARDHSLTVTVLWSDGVLPRFLRGRMAGVSVQTDDAQRGNLLASSSAILFPHRHKCWSLLPRALQAASSRCPIIGAPQTVSYLELLEEVTYFRADNLKDWVTRLTQTTDDQFFRVADECFRVLQQRCSPRNVAHQLEEVLRE